MITHPYKKFNFQRKFIFPQFLSFPANNTPKNYTSIKRSHSQSVHFGGWYKDTKHGKICFHFKDPIFSYCSEHFLNATARSLHPRKWLSIGGSSKLHTSEPGNFPSFDSWMNELRRETKGYCFFSVNGWSIKLCTDWCFPCRAIEFIWSKAGITLLKLKLTDHSMCF